MSETVTNTTKTSKSQIIGLDIGRGYVKAYSEHNNNVRECLFKSVISEGRDGLDYSNYDNPIYIEYNGRKLFAGNLAEVEGYMRKSNSRDSKTSPTVEDLIAVAISKLAVEKEVKIMLGVPYKIFNKETAEDVIKKYRGKVFKVEDKINGGLKEVKITNIIIFREADAALFHVLNGLPNMDRQVGLVSVGFRSTELASYDRGFKFNDRYSTTLEIGNRNVLEFIADTLMKTKNIARTVEEIDTSDQYEDLKKIGYDNISEQIAQEIEVLWKNLNEMDIYIAGGTALKMEFDDRFKILDDAQLATAKGLYEIAKFREQEGKF